MIKHVESFIGHELDVPLTTARIQSEAKLFSLLHSAYTDYVFCFYPVNTGFTVPRDKKPTTCNWLFTSS